MTSRANAKNAVEVQRTQYLNQLLGDSDRPSDKDIKAKLNRMRPLCGEDWTEEDLLVVLEQYRWDESRALNAVLDDTGRLRGSTWATKTKKQPSQRTKGARDQQQNTDSPGFGKQSDRSTRGGDRSGPRGGDRSGPRGGDRSGPRGARGGEAGFGKQQRGGAER
eukprot:CAMPEP_0177639814 /NCGR_PEP_ID=MMETSP0447-20121125/6219_1 /TAXON_ID=0 /ORGANISM="Stygamoeba regulata, Strain BSH-02190019" /LENGTH=163 /DNA_ID=CAMNT_0019141861 /DNA_START=32 /DNA_END=520 /DNA_ORIENTATION=-